MWFFHHYDNHWWNTSLANFTGVTHPLLIISIIPRIFFTYLQVRPQTVSYLFKHVPYLFLDSRTCINATCYIQTHHQPILLILHVHLRSCYTSLTRAYSNTLPRLFPFLLGSLFARPIFFQLEAGTYTDDIDIDNDDGRQHLANDHIWLS
jgi:hypothetical protein